MVGNSDGVIVFFGIFICSSEVFCDVGLESLTWTVDGFLCACMSQPHVHVDKLCLLVVAEPSALFKVVAAVVRSTAGAQTPTGGIYLTNQRAEIRTDHIEGIASKRTWPLLIYTCLIVLATRSVCRRSLEDWKRSMHSRCHMKCRAFAWWAPMGMQVDATVPLADAPTAFVKGEPPSEQ
jgi:hypothetical protein